MFFKYKKGGGMKIINYDDKANEINMDDISFHGTTDNNNFLNVSWVMLYNCNYKCSYCFTGQEPITDNFVSIEKLKHAIDQIFKINVDKYIFGLIGGEITFHPHLIDIMNYINSFNKTIVVTIVSNGSKSEDYFEKLLELTKNIKLNLVISIHMEYANLEHIISLTKLFNKYNNVNTTIKIMAHPEFKEKTKLFFEELIKIQKTYAFNIEIAELFGAPDFKELDNRYDEEFISWIDNSRKIIKNSEYKFDIPKSNYKYKEENISISHRNAMRYNLRKFENFYCLGGVNSLFIDFNGNYRGVSCSVLPLIGNIYDDDIDFYNLINYTKCTYKQCVCEVNDNVPKFRNKSQADEYIEKIRKEKSNLILNQFSKKISTLDNQIDILNKKIDVLNNENKKLVDTIAWWIPIKKLRENFKNKFRAEQSRAEQITFNYYKNAA